MMLLTHFLMLGFFSPTNIAFMPASGRGVDNGLNRGLQ